MGSEFPFTTSEEKIAKTILAFFTSSEYYTDVREFVEKYYD